LEQKLQKSRKKSQKSGNKNYKNIGIKVKKFVEQNLGTKISKIREQKSRKKFKI
jgi:hypothetical protein